MEVPNPGMHLLANVLLSNTFSNLNVAKKTEAPKLEAVLGMLRIQNTVWKSTHPQAEIINEFTKGNRSLQLIANIICETLGIAFLLKKNPSYILPIICALLDDTLS